MAQMRMEDEAYEARYGEENQHADWADKMMRAQDAEDDYPENRR